MSFPVFKWPLKTFHLSGVEIRNFHVHEQVGYLYLPLSVIMSYYVFNRAKAQRKEGNGIEDRMCEELDAEYLPVLSEETMGNWSGRELSLVQQTTFGRWS